MGILDIYLPIAAVSLDVVSLLVVGGGFIMVPAMIYLLGMQAVGRAAGAHRGAAGYFDLVLAAGTGQEGPGPLVTALAGKMSGGMRVPVAIVPGSLTEEQLQALA